LKLLLSPIRQREQQARQDFARATQHVQALEADARRARLAMGEQDRWARSAIDAGPGADLAGYRQAVTELGEELVRKGRELAAANERLQARRRDLVELMKQRKAMERLLHRQEAEAAADGLRKDTREMDQAHAAQVAWAAAGREEWELQA
jgi:flagellar export protein FliJ